MKEVVEHAKEAGEKGMVRSEPGRADGGRRRGQCGGSKKGKGMEKGGS